MMKMMFHHRFVTLVETNSISQGLSVRVTKVFRLLWKTVADVRCSALVNGIGGGLGASIKLIVTGFGCLV